MKFITTFLTLGLVFNGISAQISFFDQRFPPAPASRRTVVIRAGQLSGRRSAALIQAPNQQQDEPLSQQYEDSVQEKDSQEPIVQQTVPTKRPQRKGSGQPVPSRPVNGSPRLPKQQQELDQTITGPQQGSEEELSQRQDTALTDISMEDVTTERNIPSVGFTSSEELTDDGFTTEPEQRQLLTTTGSISTQRKTNGNGRQRNGNGRKTLVPSGQRPVGRDRKPINGKNGRDRQPVTQVIDANDGQVDDGRLTDQQISGQTASDGGHTDGVSAERHESGDHEDHHSGDPIQWLRDAIRGEPGADYPIFYTPPETGFRCSDQQFPGYYADVEARCQVFHICQENGRSDAFLCPNGTVFSQQNYVCVWWHDFDCSTATQFYSLNAQLYSETASPDSQILDRPVSQSTASRGEEPTGLDSAVIGPETPTDDRIQRIDGLTDERTDGLTDERTDGLTDAQRIEGQEPDLPQVFETESPSLPAIDGDTQEVLSDETPTLETFTTSAPTNGGRGPNGRPIGGLKGGQKKGNGIRNGFGMSRSNGNGVKRNGQNGSQQRVSVTTTKPITGLKRNGGTKRNGKSSQPSIPSSPADTARNGIQKTSRTNGVNGIRQQKRLNGGTKSVFRDRTTQTQELDGQSSNWYYFNGL